MQKLDNTFTSQEMKGNYTYGFIQKTKEGLNGMIHCKKDCDKSTCLIILGTPNNLTSGFDTNNVMKGTTGGLNEKACEKYYAVKPVSESKRLVFHQANKMNSSGFDDLEETFDRFVYPDSSFRHHSYIKVVQSAGLSDSTKGINLLNIIFFYFDFFLSTPYYTY